MNLECKGNYFLEPTIELYLEKDTTNKLLFFVLIRLNFFSPENESSNYSQNGRDIPLFKIGIRPDIKMRNEVK